MAKDIINPDGKDLFNKDDKVLTYNETIPEITTYDDVQQGAILESGSIGGWKLRTGELISGNGLVGISSEVTAGTDWRFWAGNVSPGSAPFRVDEAGNMVASSATISGSITATTGAIGGFDITATTIESGTDIVLDSSAKAIYINDTDFGDQGVQIEYNAGTPRMYIGNGANRFFEFDGVDASVGSESLLSNTVASLIEERANRWDNEIIFNGRDNDGLTESPSIGPGAGSITRYPFYTDLDSGDATSCIMYSANLGASPITNFNSNLEYTISIKTELAATQDIFIGLTSWAAGAVPANSTSTSMHIGFFIDDAVIYASNASGATQTKTDVTGTYTMTDWNSYRIVFTAGSDVLFYINDTLVATHSTNLPSGATVPYIYIGIEQQSGGGQKHLYVKNNYQAIQNIL